MSWKYIMENNLSSHKNSFALNFVFEFEET